MRRELASSSKFYLQTIRLWTRHWSSPIRPTIIVRWAKECKDRAVEAQHPEAKSESSRSRMTKIFCWTSRHPMSHLRSNLINYRRSTVFQLSARNQPLQVYRSLGMNQMIIAQSLIFQSTTTSVKVDNKAKTCSFALVLMKWPPLRADPMIEEWLWGKSRSRSLMRCHPLISINLSRSYNVLNCKIPWQSQRLSMKMAIIFYTELPMTTPLGLVSSWSHTISRG